MGAIEFSVFRMNPMNQIPRPPVFIFQMGKVGSSSLKSTLDDKYPGQVIHAHRFENMTPAEQKIVEERKRGDSAINVICPVRDPLSRNVSAFFQNFKRDTGRDFSEKTWTIPELRTLFLKHARHNVCLEWFDTNLRTVFDLDVFATPFSIGRKWQSYQKNALRVLIYRADLDRSNQLAVISSFLDCEIDSWVYTNRSEEKIYAQKYREFCSSVVLPDIYISIMSNSRFCRHFWSPDEIAAVSDRWRA